MDAYIERDIEYFSCERMDIHEYILLFLSFLEKRKFDFPLKRTMMFSLNSIFEKERNIEREDIFGKKT